MAIIPLSKSDRSPILLFAMNKDNIVDAIEFGWLFLHTKKQTAKLENKTRYYLLMPFLQWHVMLLI